MKPNHTLQQVIRKMLREQMDEMPMEQPPVPTMAPNATRKQFSSEQLEKIIKNEIELGTIHDQATLTSFLDSLTQSVGELRNVSYDVFLQTVKMEPTIQR